MGRSSNSLMMTKVFIMLDAFIWLAFGGIVGLGFHPALPEDLQIRWVIAGITLLVSVMLFTGYRMLQKKRAVAFYPLLGLLVLISLLTFMDQFGYSDLFILFMHLIPILLLIKDRSFYLGLENDLRTPS